MDGFHGWSWCLNQNVAVSSWRSVPLKGPAPVTNFCALFNSQMYWLNSVSFISTNENSPLFNARLLTFCWSPQVTVSGDQLMKEWIPFLETLVFYRATLNHFFQWRIYRMIILIRMAKKNLCLQCALCSFDTAVFCVIKWLVTGSSVTVFSSNSSN